MEHRSVGESDSDGRTQESTLRSAGPRICIVSENLGPPLDEGKRKLVNKLLEGLSGRVEILGISVGHGSAISDSVVSVKAGRTFANRAMRRTIRAFKPDVICYVPSSSLTAMSVLRLAVLRAIAPRARVIAVSVQPRRLPWIAKQVLKALRPAVVFAQEPESLAMLRDLGVTTKMLSSGVDLEHFCPVTGERKRELRTQYGIPVDAFIVLHVGHLKEGRNVRALTQLPEGMAAVMVGSTTMGLESTLMAELQASGVVVIDRYIEQVEELYQLADCYLFPVTSADNSIGVPLSVLEAMACDLPVVATPFGGLPLLFEEGSGVFFATTTDETLRALGRARAMDKPMTREQVEPYGWESLSERFLNDLGSTALGSTIR